MPHDADWRDCPTCWAQGRIYGKDGEGWTVTTCPTCLGIGQLVTPQPFSAHGEGEGHSGSAYVPWAGR